MQVGGLSRLQKPAGNNDDAIHELGDFGLR